MTNKYVFYDEFNPDLTPKQMLEYGVFGGSYLGDTINEYPKTWFKKAKLSKTFDVNLNCFKIRSGQSLKEWKKKGWIMKEDPRGWFQWYCRYTMGRRIPKIDKLQIYRWKMFGPRHIGGIKKNCRKRELNCRKRQRQALLQWAYDPFI
ncbi:MAG: hypothetical protein CFH22_01417 [Alphaproteobacteria bacterium MarineAlpha5_Bin12]|nr:MAG: hypothetical protein CFH22_01417 [Alphaproteobacteria bacterium MarineAlpha5_Bin12]|tara:strand:+ start:15107 stop:15550 length:444 start_codon:yes stop_codon:yes gene_type:complete